MSRPKQAGLPLMSGIPLLALAGFGFPELLPQVLRYTVALVSCLPQSERVELGFAEGKKSPVPVVDFGFVEGALSVPNSSMTCSVLSTCLLIFSRDA